MLTSDLKPHSYGQRSQSSLIGGMTLQTFAHSFAKKFAAWHIMYQAGMCGWCWRTEFCKLSFECPQDIKKTDLKTHFVSAVTVLWCGRFAGSLRSIKLFYKAIKHFHFKSLFEGIALYFLFPSLSAAVQPNVSTGPQSFKESHCLAGRISIFYPETLSWCGSTAWPAGILLLNGTGGSTVAPPHTHINLILYHAYGSVAAAELLVDLEGSMRSWYSRAEWPCGSS